MTDYLLELTKNQVELRIQLNIVQTESASLSCIMYNDVEAIGDIFTSYHNSIIYTSALKSN